MSKGPKKTAERAEPEPSAFERRLVELEAKTAQWAIEKPFLEEKLRKLTVKHERLEHEYEKLLRRMFGRSAEKVDPAQLALAFATPAPSSTPSPTQPSEVAQPAKPATTTPRKGHGRRRPPVALERRREEISPPESQLTCACGEHKVKIGEETQELLARVPASYYVRVIARLKFACPKGCEASVSCASPPPAPIDKGLPDASVLANTLTAKYADHLPLHRLSRIMRREGAPTPVSTLCGWVNLATGLLEPIVDHIQQRVVAGDYVQFDETGLRVLDRSAVGGTRSARVWTYRGEKGDVFFVHGATKANADPDGPARILAEFHGYAQADAYGGFDQLYKSGVIVEVACWAHSRRKFFEAKETAPEAFWALGVIQRLYEVEAEARSRELGAEVRRRLRLEKSAPIVEEFFTGVKQLKPVPSTPLATAVTYVLNQEKALRRFLEDGRLEPDNNAAERALRHVALGRKAWLFAGNTDGARRAATAYSLVVGCRELGLDPYAYLRDVLERVTTHPASRVAELTPRGWLEAHPEAALPT